VSIIKVNLTYGLSRATVITLVSRMIFIIIYFWLEEMCDAVHSGS
jgi:hypothetical protein